MELTVRIYALTRTFPAEERYGLVQQMRRAAVSVPSNIAEGYGRRTPRQRYNFLENALGSLFELETQTDLSARLGLLSEQDANDLMSTIRGTGRALSALMRYVEQEALTESPRGTRGTPRNPRNS